MVYHTQFSCRLLYSRKCLHRQRLDVLDYVVPEVIARQLSENNNNCIGADYMLKDQFKITFALMYLVRRVKGIRIAM